MGLSDHQITMSQNLSNSMLNVFLQFPDKFLIDTDPSKLVNGKNNADTEELTIADISNNVNPAWLWSLMKDTGSGSGMFHEIGGSMGIVQDHD